MKVYQLDQFNDGKLVSSNLYRKLQKAMDTVQKEYFQEITWSKTNYPEFTSWDYHGLFITYTITEHEVL